MERLATRPQMPLVEFGDGLGDNAVALRVVGDQAFDDEGRGVAPTEGRPMLSLSTVSETRHSAKAESASVKVGLWYHIVGVFGAAGELQLPDDADSAADKELAEMEAGHEVNAADFEGVGVDLREQEDAANEVIKDANALSREEAKCDVCGKVATPTPDP